MSDIANVTIEAFTAPGFEGGKDMNGYAIMPEIETKEVFIPSPPTTTIVPINPRLCVIYLTEEPVTPESANLDALKAYAKDNNCVLFCPEKGTADDLFSVYAWALQPDECKRMNLKHDVIAVKSDEASYDLADELTEILEDEEIEPDDTEVLAL